ncbi:MAG: hypothetical protein V4662_20780 [Verrucomicrobiota bacterium]
MKTRLIQASALLGFSVGALYGADTLTPITEGASPHFMKVMSHLEVGGSSLSYQEQSSIWASLSTFFDSALAKMPAEQKKDIPPNLSFAKLFEVMGLDLVKAVGSSVRTMPNGQNHLTTFAFIPEGRKGLMTLSGGPAEPLLLHAVSPKGTDLVLEFPLHTKDAAKVILEHMRPLMPKAEQAKMDESLKTPIPVLGLTSGELIERLAARVALVARLNPDQQLPAGDSGVTLPGIDAALVIERIGWLLEPLSQQFLPLLKNGGAPVDLKEEGNTVILTFKGPMGPEPMDFQPCLHWDKTTDRVILATRVAFLKALLDPADKLAKTPAFESEWQGLPTSGNGALYVSTRLQQALLDLVPQAMKKSDKSSAADLEMMKSILEWVKPYTAHAQSFTQANLADGTLGSANTTLPVSQGSALATITTISILSSLAVPSFNVIQDSANQTKVSANGKQVGIALKVYAAGNDGRYPEKLSALIAKDLIVDDVLLVVADPQSSQPLPWLYDATLTESSPAEAILLATPFAYRGEKRIIVQNDGSALVIKEEEFQERRKETLE